MIITFTLRRALLIAFLIAATLPAHADDDELVLRVQDAVAAPGGDAVISLRTYATRPVGQGTICLAMRDTSGGMPPLSAFKGAKVFGQAGDVVERFDVIEQNGAMIIDLMFSSASASINTVDGPMAALYFTVSPDAVPGSKIAVDLDLDQTTLSDENGLPIVLQQRGGELTIRHPSAPLEVAAEADLPDVVGDPVTVSFQSNEPFCIGSGQVAIRYGRRVLSGPAQLLEDPRFGLAKIKMDHDPGLVMFNVLESAPGFNDLPGNILSVLLEPAVNQPPDAELDIIIDPALTYLYDKDGSLLPIAIDNDVDRLPRTPPAEQPRRQHQRSEQRHKP